MSDDDILSIVADVVARQDYAVGRETPAPYVDYAGGAGRSARPVTADRQGAAHRCRRQSRGGEVSECWIDSLCDLISRMDDAELKLVDLAAEHRPNSTEGIRLDAKANGVRLASGFVSEELRRVRSAARQ